MEGRGRMVVRSKTDGSERAELDARGVNISERDTSYTYIPSVLEQDLSMVR